MRLNTQPPTQYRRSIPADASIKSCQTCNPPASCMDTNFVRLVFGCLVMVVGTVEQSVPSQSSSAQPAVHPSNTLPFLHCPHKLRSWPRRLRCRHRCSFGCVSLKYRAHSLLFISTFECFHPCQWLCVIFGPKKNILCRSVGVGTFAGVFFEPGGCQSVADLPAPLLAQYGEERYNIQLHSHIVALPLGLYLAA